MEATVGKPNLSRFRRHVELAKQRISERPPLFESVFSETLIRDTLNQLGMVFRERVYPPWITLWAFLGQVLSGDGACQQAVQAVYAWCIQRGQEPPVPDTGHYCEARRRLPLELLKTLLSRLVERAQAEVPPSWKWLGKHLVKVVDGTTFTLPDSPANRDAYPPDGETTPGLRYPLLRLVAIFSLPLGLVQEFRYGPYQGKGTGEISLFRQLLDAFQPGEVLLADKYYCSYRDVCTLLAKEVHCVVKHFAVRTTLKTVKRLSKTDKLVRWQRPKFAHQKMSRTEFQKLPESLLVRIVTVRVAYRGFRTQTFEVLTTLLDADVYTATALGELYFQRWRGELFLDEIKTTLGLDRLRCRSPEMVAKELLVGLLAYNSIRLQMAQAAETLDVPLREISFTTTLRVLRQLGSTTPLDRPLHSDRKPPHQNRLAYLLATIVHSKVGHRPGRTEPRAVKRKAKPYPPLKSPRPSFQTHRKRQESLKPST
jgi:hypothetical protein